MMILCPTVCVCFKNAVCNAVIVSLRDYFKLFVILFLDFLSKSQLYIRIDG